MASAADDIVERVGSIAFGIVILVVVLSTLVGTFTIAQGSIPLNNGVATFDSPDVQNATIKNSTGRAAALNGNGAVEVTGALGVRGDTWSFSTFVAVDNSSRSQVVWSVRDNWVLSYDGGTSEWVLWYYNSSSTNSYSTAVAASPSGLTNVQAQRDGQTVTLYNGTDASSSFTITPGTDSSAPLPATQSLDGRLEETRVWKTTLNASQRQALRDEPLNPVGVGNRTARLMFDTSGSGVAIDFTGASGSLTGDATRGSGFAGTKLVAGVDYRIDTSGQVRLIALDGGSLEDMPRVAVIHNGLHGIGILGQLLGVINSALGVLTLLMLAAAGGFALKVFGDGGF
jgi:hypothetical protein